VALLSLWSALVFTLCRTRHKVSLICRSLTRHRFLCTMVKELPTRRLPMTSSQTGPSQMLKVYSNRDCPMHRIWILADLGNAMIWILLKPMTGAWSIPTAFANLFTQLIAIAPHHMSRSLFQPSRIASALNPARKFTCQRKRSSIVTRLRMDATVATLIVFSPGVSAKVLSPMIATQNNKRQAKRSP